MRFISLKIKKKFQWVAVNQFTKKDMKKFKFCLNDLREDLIHYVFSLNVWQGMAFKMKCTDKY